jgi:hypothetical protein
MPENKARWAGTSSFMAGIFSNIPLTRVAEKSRKNKLSQLVATLCEHRLQSNPLPLLFEEEIGRLRICMITFMYTCEDDWSIKTRGA